MNYEFKIKNYSFNYNILNPEDKIHNFEFINLMLDDFSNANLC